MQSSDMPDLAGGFKLTERRDIPGIRSHALRARHIRSGADLVFLRNPGDREKLFTAVFRTPPTDSTGVPHILEHCVLCGSRKFPLKDPFMELVKTSMATYINAITYDDRTIYPCASLNGKDFFNLVDVYMDAVFHPLLTRQAFMQEGHRMDIGESGSVARMGVVYSEMRGAYSDPDDFMERQLRSLLFPGATYGNCSGGDPDQIPRLSYQSFLDYHRRHYHPSNCCLLVIGDFPENEITGFLGERLEGFNALNSQPEIITGPGLRCPISGVYPIPGPRRAGCTVLRGWLMDRGDDPVESLALSLLDDVLLDGDAAPLKAALVESCLGAGLGPSGYDSNILIPTFTAGLRGVPEKDAPEVFELLDTTLKKCSDGLDPRDVQGCLHRKELFLRSIGQRWAFGIMGAVARAWTYRRNPLDELEEEKLLDGLHQRLSRCPRYLEELIGKYLTDNPGRVDAVFRPEPGHFGRLGRKRAGRAKTEAKRLSPDQQESLRTDSEALRIHQESPDTPEAAASLPSLNLSDIPEEPAILEWHHEAVAPGVHLITVPGFTNGVCHLNLSLGLGHLSAANLPLAQLAAEAVAGTGAGELSHQEAAREEMACSGGLSNGVATYEPLSAAGAVHPLITFGVSCLEADLPRLLNLLRMRILSPRLDNRARVKELGREIRSGIHANFTENAGSYAGLESLASFRPGMEVVRLLKGLEMARQTLAWAGRASSTLSGKLLELWSQIGEKAPLALSWTGPDRCRLVIEGFLAEVECDRTRFSPIGFDEREYLPITGIQTDSDVACTAGAFPGREMGDPLFEPLYVLTSLLGNGPLWQLIRGKLGAYGVSAGAGSGVVAFSTYRDPSPSESLSVIRRIFDNPMGSVDLSEKAVRGAVFSVLQRLDPLIRPSRAPLSATMMFFTEMDRKYQTGAWKRLLAIDEPGLTLAAETLHRGVAKASVCVAADRKTLTEIGVTNIEKL